jgi:hypothetical protein
VWDLLCAGRIFGSEGGEIKASLTEPHSDDPHNSCKGRKGNENKTRSEAVFCSVLSRWLNGGE